MRPGLPVIQHQFMTSSSPAGQELPPAAGARLSSTRDLGNEKEDVMEPGKSQRGWAYAGLVAALLLLPVLHLAAVDLESTTASPDAYLRHIDDRYLSISVAGSVGLLLTVLLIVHLAGMRRFAAARHPLLADAAVAVGGLAVLGLAIGLVSSIMAAYGAHERYPFEAVRPMGMLAENFAAGLLPALAGPAVLIAVLGLRDKVLSRLLGYIAGFFAVVLTVLGVVLPGSAALPALLWLLISTASLSMVRSRDTLDRRGASEP